MAKKKTIEVPPSTVELVSYSIKAVIPTGSYANIQPEIIVKAKNLDEAATYVIPHINKLFREFLNKGDRPETFAVSQSVVSELEKARATPTVMTTATSGAPEAVITATSGTPYIEPTTAFKKAEQAVGSCLSSEALQLIEGQISKSVKLTSEEKFALLKLVEIKATELFNKK